MISITDHPWLSAEDDEFDPSDDEVREEEEEEVYDITNVVPTLSGNILSDFWFEGMPLLFPASYEWVQQLKGMLTQELQDEV